MRSIAQLALRDVLHQIRRIRRERRARRVDVGHHENPLLREIHHQQRVGMRASRHAVQVDGARGVLELQLLVNRLDLDRLGILRERIRHDRVRPCDGVLKVLRAGFLRDDGQAFRDGRADAARMIEVVVAVDDVGQRLVRLDLSRLGDDRQRARVVLRRFDERHVIRELDEDAVMASAGEPPDARRDFLHGDHRRRRHGRRR